jgi:hypothetical protein
MLSSFCSREFGYGFDLNASQLATVNAYRHGKEYVDEVAAIEVFGRKEKAELKDSPFTQKFEYGINSDRFWNYHHMVVQFEDVTDVLKALFHDQFDFLFFFNHSSGHDKLRPNGLNSNTMNKNYGGDQNNMRDSKIKNKSYLDPFHHPQKLRVGQTQSMQFALDDNGPFYLSEEKRQQLKFDQTSSEIEQKNIQEHNLLIR